MKRMLMNWKLDLRTNTWPSRTLIDEMNADELEAGLMMIGEVYSHAHL